jgi:hypothetical protein
MLVGLVAACGAGARGGGGTSASGFRVFYADMPAGGFHAKVGKRFYAKPVGNCKYDDGRDAHWAMTGARVTTGKLPPGLTLEDGAISGVPVEPGSFPLQIEVAGLTCKSDAYDKQVLDVTIVVDAAGAVK